jgi:hypothetical protein
MKEELTEEINESTRQAHQDYLSKWQFEWFLTIRLPSLNHSFYLSKIRNAFLREEGGQIGYMGIFVNGYDGMHLHLLMLGRFSGGRTLKDIDLNKWELKICQNVRDVKGCKIIPVFDVAGAAKYVVKEKNTPKGRYEMLVPWGRILNKTKHSITV